MSVFSQVVEAEAPEGMLEYEYPKTIEQLIEKYDWDHDTALAVARAESNLNPQAYNPEWHRGCQGSIGIFQIACIHDDPEKLFEVEYNIQRAYEIYSEQGWKPWGAYTNGNYRRYIANHL